MLFKPAVRVWGCEILVCCFTSGLFSIPYEYAAHGKSHAGSLSVACELYTPLAAHAPLCKWCTSRSSLVLPGEGQISPVLLRPVLQILLVRGSSLTSAFKIWFLYQSSSQKQEVKDYMENSGRQTTQVLQSVKLGPLKACVVSWVWCSKLFCCHTRLNQSKKEINLAI